MLPQEQFQNSPTWEYPSQHQDNRNKLTVDTTFMPVYSNYQEPSSAGPYVSTFQQQSMTYDGPMSAPPVDMHFDYYSNNNYYPHQYQIESPQYLTASPPVHPQSLHSPQLPPSSPMLSPQLPMEYRSPQIPIPAQKKLSKQQHMQRVLEKINFEDITVSELKDILRACGLSATGKKQILVERVRLQRSKVLGCE